MAAPYYGAYAATAFMAKADSISSLDAGTSAYAVYIAYDTSNAPIRALLYNSDYYDGTGVRTNQTFVLSNLQGQVTAVTAQRLTAGSALSRVDSGDAMSFGGKTFTDGSCVIAGTEAVESAGVVDGEATFVVAATEALLVTF